MGDGGANLLLEEVQLYDAIKTMLLCIMLEDTGVVASAVYLSGLLWKLHDCHDEDINLNCEVEKVSDFTISVLYFSPASGDSLEVGCVCLTSHVCPCHPALHQTHAQPPCCPFLSIKG